MGFVRVLDLYDIPKMLYMHYSFGTRTYASQTFTLSVVYPLLNRSAKQVTALLEAQNQRGPILMMILKRIRKKSMILHPCVVLREKAHLAGRAPQTLHIWPDVLAVMQKVAGKRDLRCC